MCVCVCVSLRCLLGHLNAFDHTSYLLVFGVCVCVCAFQRGAQRTSVNNDITSASINLLLPPSGRGVVGVQRRKQECQE